MPTSRFATHTQAELYQIALDTRQRLEPSWQADPVRLQYWSLKPLSYGQCARSTDFLLGEGLRGAGRDSIQRHAGRLAFKQELSLPAVEPHTWLSVGEVIIDMTADQEGYQEPIICHTPEQLEDLGIRYTARYTWLVKQEGGQPQLERLPETPEMLQAWAARKEY